MSKTEVTKKSWSNFQTSDQAEKYLKNYPNQSAYKILEFLGKDVTRIIDVACGNAQLYPVFKEQNSDIVYTGLDFSEPLINAAQKTVSSDENARIISSDMYDYLLKTDDAYDLSILSHIVECCESPDLLLGRLSSISKYIAIRWYNPPRYQYDFSEIRLSPLSGDIGNSPYIRREMSSDYYKHLLNKHNLKIIYEFSGTDLLHILTSQ